MAIYHPVKWWLGFCNIFELGAKKQTQQGDSVSIFYLPTLRNPKKYGSQSYVSSFYLEDTGGFFHNSLVDVVQVAFLLLGGGVQMGTTRSTEILFCFFLWGEVPQFRHTARYLYEWTNLCTTLSPWSNPESLSEFTLEHQISENSRGVLGHGYTRESNFRIPGVP